MKARVVVLLLLGSVGGFACGQGVPVGSAQEATQASRPAAAPASLVSEAPIPKGLSEEERRDIDVFRRSSPSVVYITSIALQRDFFSMDVEEIPQGTGSGFVWDRDGHIVTNFHVVENGSKFSVTLSDQSDWEAEVVGTAPDKDLAVLKIKAPADKLVPLPVGESADLLVGQRVYAVGNPFGLDHTLTMGIVSALGRELSSPSGRKIRDVIQTDAAINPGNSGGPLLDSSARLIGINTAIFSPSGASAGIGFAVPIDSVKRLVPQIIKTGRVVRPGIGIVPVPDTLARRLGVDEGVVIGRVGDGTPARAAGLDAAVATRSGRVRLGDVILGVNGQKIRGNDDLFYAFEEAGVGSTVTLSVARDGKRRDVKVKLIELNARAD